MSTRFLQQISLVSLADAIATPTLGSFKAQAQTIPTPANTQFSNKAALLPITQLPEPAPAAVQQPIQDQVTPAPSPGLSPGRATRRGSSYIGVGGNIGLGGNTTLSEGSFAVISKIGLSNNFSVRPSALIGDNNQPRPKPKP
jgi:hypothetical protein